MEPLVSIVIPTYNRAALIGETLDSISQQTYRNWECIIVDDGSDDATPVVVQDFVSKDLRFKYYKRPEKSSKGANACRNYGFQKSIGDYIIWFDSDDLMHPYKIEKQMFSLLSDNEMEFCISKFSNFINRQEPFEKKAFNSNIKTTVSLQTYMKNGFFFGTIDFLGKRAVFDGCAFNEQLQSGQEFHFFMGVLAKKPKGVFLNESLALRRIHDNSIQQNQKRDKKLRLVNKFQVYWTTYQDYKLKIDRDARVFLLQTACLYYYRTLLYGIPSSLKIASIAKEVKENFGLLKAILIFSLFKFTRSVKKGDLIGTKIIKKNIR